MFFLFLISVTIKAEIPKLKFLPKIDGILSKEEYGEAFKFEEFYEVSPKENVPSDVKTILFIGYTDDALYFAFKCYDNVNEIRKTYTPRDNLTGTDDFVGIYLDPYNNLKESYFFWANPLGVQYDGTKREPGGLDDITFDTDWEVKTLVKDSFWTAEFRIPFSSLRFIPKDTLIFRFHAVRYKPREVAKIYSLFPISRNIPNFISQGGELLIPEKIEIRERKLSLLPYLISFQNGLREIEYKYKKIDYSLGLSGKYNFSRNIYLDFALNPDFAQIETDEPQIDVNNPYSIYYPEKRPLFLEGLSLFSLPIDVFYTRMVVKPLYALKFNGRIRKYDFSLFSSYDEKTSFIIPFEDFSTDIFTDKKSFLNLLRIKKDFLNEESHIGFLVSSREIRKDSFDNGFNRIFSFDTKIRFLKNYTISYQGVYSVTKEPEDTNLLNYGDLKFYKDYTYTFDGEKLYGFANKLWFGSHFRNLNFNIKYIDFSPFFRSDIGYITKNNTRGLEIYIGPSFYPNKYGFSEIYFSYGYWRFYNYDNILKDEGFFLSHFAKLSISQINYSISYSHTLKRNIFGKDFKDLGKMYFYLSSSPFKWLFLNANIKLGKTIYYNELIPAYNQIYSMSAEFLLGKFTSTFSFTKYFLYRKPWENTIYDIGIFDLRLNYQITKFLSFRLITSYYSHSKNLLIYPLISYEVSPFTLFYFGLNSNSLKYEKSLKGMNHQIFLKFQYWFKI